MRQEELALQEAAEAAERSGDLESAFDAWRTLSSIDVNRPDYLCKLGRAAQRLERWTESEQAFLDAISLEKTFWPAMALLGSLFLKRTDGDRSANGRAARVWLEQAIALNPYPASFSFLGFAHLRLGKREAAKEAFRKAIELDESYEEAYFNLGLLLADDGENVEAERLLRRATQLDPNFHIAHGRLGILLKDQGRYSEAEAELGRAVEIDPSDAIASFHLSRIPRA